MSDANQAALYYVEESTWGETPSSATMNEVRFTSEDISQTTDTTQSDEVRSDRQVTDVIRTSINASGSINWEFSAKNIDDLIAGFFMDDWPGALGISGIQIDVDATNTKFTSDTSANGGDLSGVQAGQWIKTSGFSTSANNDYWRVNSVDTSSDVHEVVVDDPGGNLSDETGDGDEAMDGEVVFNGTTVKSYTIEKEYKDVSAWDNFTGMVVDSLELNVSQGSQITGTLGFTGKKGADSATSSVGTSTSSAPNNEVMNSIDHVGMVREGGSSTSVDIESISISGENNVRTKDVIAQLGPADVGLGTIAITGSMNTYFDDRTLLDKYRKFNTTSLSFKLEDGDGNAYIWDIPEINITEAPAVIAGRDEFVMANISFSAKIDPNINETISLTRF